MEFSVLPREMFIWFEAGFTGGESGQRHGKLGRLSDFQPNGLLGAKKKGSLPSVELEKFRYSVNICYKSRFIDVALLLTSCVIWGKSFKFVGSVWSGKQKPT